MNFESPIALASLGEYLAGRGFVVATCPLAGTQSPFVTLDIRDLDTQVRDLELVVARARRLPYVSPSGLGVAGFDMGGMAGLIVAMRNADVDAFASLESGILRPHPSGLPAAASDYDPGRLRVPWLHVSARSGGAPDAREPSLMDSAVHAERYHLRLDDLRHEDVTSYALIEGRNARLGFWSSWDTGGVERQGLVARYTSTFFEAYLKSSEVSRDLLAKDAREKPSSRRISLEYRAATREPMTHARFVEALLTGDAARAVEELRRLRSVDSTSALVGDEYLYRLAYTLLYRWGFGEEAIRVSELNVELNPFSSRAVQGLSMGYVERGDHAAAVEVYRRYLERKPDDEAARRTLEWLERQLDVRDEH